VGKAIFALIITAIFVALVSIFSPQGPSTPPPVAPPAPPRTPQVDFAAPARPNDAVVPPAPPPEPAPIPQPQAAAPHVDEKDLRAEDAEPVTPPTPPSERKQNDNADGPVTVYRKRGKPLEGTIVRRGKTQIDLSEGGKVWFIDLVDIERIEGAEETAERKRAFAERMQAEGKVLFGGTWVTPVEKEAAEAARLARAEREEAATSRQGEAGEQGKRATGRDPAAPKPSMPLGLAMSRGDVAQVRLHLANGFDINKRDEVGYMLLHHAAANGDEAMTAFLIEKGADLRARASGKETVLHFSCRRGSQSAQKMWWAKRPCMWPHREVMSMKQEGT